jgi:hypothetical protein
VFGEKDPEGSKVISLAESLETSFRSAGEVVEFAEFGLCKDCGHFIGILTKFDKKFVKCSEITVYGLKLDSLDPVKSCTCYYKRGQLDIHSMKDMATMIEIRNDLGFQAGEKIDGSEE